MGKNNRPETIGNGGMCPKCHIPMERREHKKIGEKQLTKTFYFREWDYCPKCYHIQHYEQFKVFSKDYAKKLEILREDEENQSFINNLN